LSILRLIRPADPVAVELLGLNAGKISVPHLIGLIRQGDAVALLGSVRRVEEAKLDLGGML